MGHNLGDVIGQKTQLDDHAVLDGGFERRLIEPGIPLLQLLADFLNLLFRRQGGDPGGAAALVEFG